MEANVIHATTYGNEDVHCQSDFHPIIFLITRVLQINDKIRFFLLKRLTFVFTLMD